MATWLTLRSFKRTLLVKRDVRMYLMLIGWWTFISTTTTKSNCLLYLHLYTGACDTCYMSSGQKAKKFLRWAVSKDFEKYLHLGQGNGSNAYSGLPLLSGKCSCHRQQNVDFLCVSFLCSLDDFILKNVTFFFLEIKVQKGAHLKKKWLLMTYFSYFLVTRERTKKFLQHISHLHTYKYFARPVDFIFLENFAKITISSIPGVDSYSCHFGVINK